MIVAAWWMLREIEAANLRARHVTFRCVRGALVAEISLPVSKSDPEAKGVARAHACLVSDGPVRRDCPAHTAFLHLRALRSLFPSRFTAGAPDLDLPFFPQASGAPCVQGRLCRDDPPRRGVARDRAHL